MTNGTKKGMVLLLGMGLLLTACRTEEKAEDKIRTVPRVKTVRVEIRELSKPIHTYGRVASKKEIRLSFKIGGIIQTIAVEEGQTVKKGRILARLNLAEIRSQVEQARSSAEKAGRDLERIKSLYEEKAATLEQYQNTQTYARVAQSQLQAAEFNLRHAEIRAPSDGRILKRLMEENEMTGPGSPVFFFASLDRDWIIRVGVSDRDLVRLTLGDEAVVTFDAYPESTFKAEVSEIVESADPMTGTYEVELRLAAADKKLVSGFIAEVVLSPSATRLFSLIPVEALVRAEGVSGRVFTVDPDSGIVAGRTVTIAFLFDRFAAVSEGLEGTPLVVTDGASTLTDGQMVEIVR
ncbi:MAG: efflux RND transporter periplasmic adaptor subunit [Acidobacteria bacterium]|nr:efflux RND transporter periplasmic adaptor subunit [Acidobacteriota bacterium]